MKKIIVSLLFVSFFLGGFFTSQLISEKRIQTITQEKEKYKVLSEKIKEYPEKECKQDINLTLEKVKAIEDVVDSNIYFTFQKSTQSSTQITVVVTMVGGSGMKVDASDLVLQYSNNLKITKITPGTAFPSYPRLIAENGVITVTGLATLDSNGMVLGTPNKTFVTLEIEKMGDLKENATLTVDKASTKAFLQGNSVLDESKTDFTIEL